MREIIASIDLGSSKIKLVVAEIVNDKFNILCAIDEESRGIEKGIIIEPSETEYAVKRLLKRANELLNVKISKAILSIAEESCEFKIGEASISISSEDKEIVAQDIIHVLQASLKGQIEDNMELITVIPIMFKVDDKKTRIPKNMKGDSLSVKAVIVTALNKDVYTAAKVLEKCGVEVVDININSIGSYYAHKDESTDTTTGIVIDCGAETFKISVINKGIIINNIVLNIGGNDIDKDISYIYKLSSQNAKELKETLGIANRKNASSKDKEVLTNTQGEKVEINQYELAEIINSRLMEMLNMSKNEINYLTKKEISYIIITGGLSELEDFSLSVESVFGRIARVGKIQIIGARDNKYASCIGMIKYFDTKLKLRDKEFSIFSDDELDILSAQTEKRGISGDSILGKVFGIFFDN